MQNVRPRDPVTLGLCSLKDLNDAVDKARRKAPPAKKAAAKATARGAGASRPLPPKDRRDPA